MSEVKLLQGDCIELMKNITDESIKKLYIEERYSLRKIAKILNTDHHTIKRKLQNMGVPLNNKNRKREPFSKEHRYKISESKKGCQSWCKGKKMPYIAILKNMITHIKWNVDLDFYLQFNNIEKLKALNKLLTRERVSKHFDTNKYKEFILKFYYDEQFNKQFEIYSASKNRWDKPSLDHITPLSKGGTWGLENLQIISWFENRAKCDMDNEEFQNMIRKYFQN